MGNENRIEIIPDQELQTWLVAATGKAFGFRVDEGLYRNLLLECEKLHPKYNARQKENWAAYTAILRERRHKDPGKPALFRFNMRETTLIWIWRLTVVGLLALITVRGI